MGNQISKHVKFWKFALEQFKNTTAAYERLLKRVNTPASLPVANATLPGLGSTEAPSTTCHHLVAPKPLPAYVSHPWACLAIWFRNWPWKSGRISIDAPGVCGRLDRLERRVLLLMRREK